MEEYVDDIPRARAVFELAINQPVLDMPEVLWKAYIDFELKQENYQEALVLHRRLLERTQHVQVRKKIEPTIALPGMITTATACKFLQYNDECTSLCTFQQLSCVSL